MSTRQIALKMGLSQSRVEQLLARALDKMRAALQEPEFADIRDEFGAWVGGLNKRSRLYLNNRQRKKKQEMCDAS